MQKQLARELTSITDEDAATANPYPDSGRDQLIALLSKYVRLARHRDIEINMQRDCAILVQLLAV
jgi:hypothetical protein